MNSKQGILRPNQDHISYHSYFQPEAETGYNWLKPVLMDLALFEKLRNKRENLGLDFSTIKIINTGLEPAITPRLTYICNVKMALK